MEKSNLKVQIELFDYRSLSSSKSLKSKDKFQIRRNGQPIAYRSSLKRARNYVQSLFDRGFALPDDHFTLYKLTVDYKFYTIA